MTTPPLKRFEFSYGVDGEYVDDPQGDWVRYADAAAVVESLREALAVLREHVPLTGIGRRTIDAALAATPAPEAPEER